MQTNVKTHQRVSKNGKTHTVKHHSRNFTPAQQVLSAMKKAGPKNIAKGTALTGAFTALVWILSTSTSVLVAAIWAIVLVCLSILAYALSTKQDRRRTRREFRHAAATSMKRRAKLWAHHRMATFTKPKPQPTQEAPKKAAKATKPKTPKKATEGVTHDSHFYCVGEGKLCKPGKHYDHFAEKRKTDATQKNATRNRYTSS